MNASARTLYDTICMLAVLAAGSTRATVLLLQNAQLTRELAELRDAGARRPPGRDGVHLEQPEVLGVARLPLEAVDQRPVEVPLHGDAFLERAPHRVHVRLE